MPLVLEDYLEFDYCVSLFPKAKWPKANVAFPSNFTSPFMGTGCTAQAIAFNMIG
jgi:hypothetical protein